MACSTIACAAAVSCAEGERDEPAPSIEPVPAARREPALAPRSERAPPAHDPSAEPRAEPSAEARVERAAPPEPGTPVDGALPEKMGRRLRRELRQRHHARAAIRASALARPADGGTQVWALYEYSTYEACVNASPEPDRAEVRRRCRNQLSSRSDNPESARCTTFGIARVDFGPTSADRPAVWGGGLTFVAEHEIEGAGCIVERVRAFALRDVDEDGEPELEVDLWARDPQRIARGQVDVDVQVRWVALLDARSLAPQLAVVASLQQPFESANSEARRFELRDVDSDGHPDVLLDEVEYPALAGCAVDPDTGWPDPGEELEELCRTEPQRTVLVYDAAADRWVPRDPP